MRARHVAAQATYRSTIDDKHRALERQDASDVQKPQQPAELNRRAFPHLGFGTGFHQAFNNNWTFCHAPTSTNDNEKRLKAEPKRIPTNKMSTAMNQANGGDGATSSDIDPSFSEKVFGQLTDGGSLFRFDLRLQTFYVKMSPTNTPMYARNLMANDGHSSSFPMKDSGFPVERVSTTLCKCMCEANFECIHASFFLFSVVSVPTERMTKSARI